MGPELHKQEAIEAQLLSVFWNGVMTIVEASELVNKWAIGNQTTWFCGTIQLHQLRLVAYPCVSSIGRVGLLRSLHVDSPRNPHKHC